MCEMQAEGCYRLGTKCHGVPWTEGWVPFSLVSVSDIGSGDEN